MLAPSQWETPLRSNTVSHWLGISLESVLYLYVCIYARLVWPSMFTAPWRQPCSANTRKQNVRPKTDCAQVNCTHHSRRIDDYTVYHSNRHIITYISFGNFDVQQNPHVSGLPNVASRKITSPTVQPISFFIFGNSYEQIFRNGHRWNSLGYLWWGCGWVVVASTSSCCGGPVGSRPASLNDDLGMATRTDLGVAPPTGMHPTVTGLLAKI